MIAAMHSSTEVISLLLEAGANTDLQNKVKGKVMSMYCSQTSPHERKRVWWQLSDFLVVLNQQSYFSMS